MNFLSKSLRLKVQGPNLIRDLKGLRNSGGIARSLQASSRNYSQFLQRDKNVNQKLHQINTRVILPTSAVIAMSRWISSQEVTKNLHLITEKPRKFEKDVNTLRLTQNVEDDKPLVVMFSWLNSKKKHLMKYAQLYVDQGFDMLLVQVSPWQLLWPVRGTQQVAGDIVKFLQYNDYYKQLTLHGFSVGGYVFGECLVHMNKDLKNHQNIIDRFVAQIWDSAADITEIPVGVPKALFPRNPRLQAPLRNYMVYHLRTFHEAATQHYIRSSQMFHTNLVHAPALFIVSKTDPVGAEASNQRVADSWISNGTKITWKCFDNSPHVMHYMKYREEYTKLLFNHLASVNLIKYPEKIRAKL